MLPENYIVSPHADLRNVPVKKLLDGAADHLMYLGSKFPNHPVRLHNE